MCLSATALKVFQIVFIEGTYLDTAPKQLPRTLALIGVRLPSIGEVQSYACTCRDEQLSGLEKESQQRAQEASAISQAAHVIRVSMRQTG